VGKSAKSAEHPSAAGKPADTDHKPVAEVGKSAKSAQHLPSLAGTDHKPAAWVGTDHKPAAWAGKPADKTGQSAK
jgi:hypothetical protein